MSFSTEPTGYIKTALSDLQGAWGNLRNEVVEHFGFPDSDKLLFHIDEAMSWESVRNLQYMKSVWLLVHNIAAQSEAPESIREWAEEVRIDLEEAIVAVQEGEAE